MHYFDAFLSKAIPSLLCSPFEQISLALSLIHISEPTRPLYISYAVFCLKKTQEEYRKLVGKKATLKTSSSAQEEVKANSESEELKDNPESEELKGHGYSVSVAEPMPEKFVQKDYIEELVSLCSKRHQSSARKLVQDLEKKTPLIGAVTAAIFSLRSKKLPLES